MCFIKPLLIFNTFYLKYEAKIMASNNYQSNPYVGTEIKLNVSIDPIDGVTMDDYEFVIEAYCSTKRIQTITKHEAQRIDRSNYKILLDTSVLGAGDLKCRITAMIPDDDFEDGLRTEVAVVDTGITIVKS